MAAYKCWCISTKLTAKQATHKVVTTLNNRAIYITLREANMSQNTPQNDTFAGHFIVLGTNADRHGLRELAEYRQLAEYHQICTDAFGHEEDDYSHLISPGRIEFERALNHVLQTHTWPQVLALMVNNEREHHD